jgi:hypothetical protein
VCCRSYGSHLHQPHGGLSLLPNEPKRNILCLRAKQKKGLQSDGSVIPTPTPERQEIGWENCSTKPLPGQVGAAFCF